MDMNLLPELSRSAHFREERELVRNQTAPDTMHWLLGLFGVIAENWLLLLHQNHLDLLCLIRGYQPGDIDSRRHFPAAVRAAIPN